MKLKFIVTNETDLPTDPTLKGLYTKHGDKWVLDIEGAVPKTQLDEFRDNNTELKKQLDAKKDIDPVRYADLVKREGEFIGGSAKTKAEVDALVESRTAAMRTEHETAIAAEKSRTAKLQSDLESHVIDRALIEAGTALGLRASAHEDITYRGRKSFKLDEHGKPVATDADGKVIYNAAGDPMTPGDFVTGLTKAAPHLFDASSGSGAGGSGKGGAGTGAPGNPWKQDSYNVTIQSQIFKSNPEQARALAAAAGVKL